VVRGSFAFKNDSRLGVHLTNSLEKPPKEVPELFMEKWLAGEANKANCLPFDLWENTLRITPGRTVKLSPRKSFGL
jgi:hypothetical protein